jgi:hypothetical protein
MTDDLVHQTDRCMDCEARMDEKGVICDACHRRIQLGFAADRLRHGDDGLAAALTADLLDQAAHELAGIGQARAETSGNDKAGSWYRVHAGIVATVRDDLDEVAKKDPTLYFPERLPLWEES